MKNFKFFLTAVLIALSSTSFAQWQPAPLQNEFFDALVGTSSAQVMRNGKSYTNTVTCKWDLNHQFLIINLTTVSNSDPGEPYQGMGIWGIDMQGNVKSWWFDIYGAEFTGTSTGKINGNKMEMTDESKNKKGTTTMELTDDSVIYSSKGTYITTEGKESSYEETAVYKRNK